MKQCKAGTLTPDGAGCYIWYRMRNWERERPSSICPSSLFHPSLASVPASHYSCTEHCTVTGQHLKRVKRREDEDESAAAWRYIYPCSVLCTHVLPGPVIAGHIGN